MTRHSPATPATTNLLREVAEGAARSGVFGAVRQTEGALHCEARGSGAPAEYRLLLEGGTLWVALVTADRWLSQSIEQDLVHTGDKIDELVEEEAIDLGWDRAWGPARWRSEHFRDERKMYTFRSPAPVDVAGPDAARRAGMALLAYERAFRPLGDMEAGED